MFEIFRFKYVDVKTRNKFEIYSRTVEFSDKLIERITALGVFNLRRARFGFCKKMRTNTPPYEIECEQLEAVEHWEAKTTPFISEK